MQEASKSHGRRLPAIRLRTLVLGSVALLAIATFSFLLLSFLMLVGYPEHLRFRGIQVGDTREQVIQSMGLPHRESATFELSQYQGYEREYEEAKVSGATTWLFYHGGIDQTFAVGLGPDDKVVYKASGGT